MCTAALYKLKLLACVCPITYPKLNQMLLIHCKTKGGIANGLLFTLCISH